MDYNKFFYDKSEDDFGPAPPSACFISNRSIVDNMVYEVDWGNSCKAVISFSEMHGDRPMIEAHADGVELVEGDSILLIGSISPYRIGVYDVAEIIPYNRCNHARLVQKEIAEDSTYMTYITDGDVYRETIWAKERGTNSWFRLAASTTTNE